MVPGNELENDEDGGQAAFLDDLDDDDGDHLKPIIYAN
jgi:hypothetical protein